MAEVENTLVIFILSIIVLEAVICTIASLRKVLSKRNSLTMSIFVICLNYCVSSLAILVSQIEMIYYFVPATDLLIVTLTFVFEIAYALECIGFMVVCLTVFYSPSPAVNRGLILFVIGWIVELGIYVWNANISSFVSFSLTCIVFSLLAIQSKRAGTRLRLKDGLEGARGMKQIFIATVLLLIAFTSTVINFYLIRNNIFDTKSSPLSGVAIILGAIGIAMFYIGFFRPKIFSRSKTQPQVE